MHTVSAFFPVARPRDAAALLLAAPAHGARVTEAVGLAFDVPAVGEYLFALHTARVAAGLQPA